MGLHNQKLGEELSKFECKFCLSMNSGIRTSSQGPLLEFANKDWALGNYCELCQQGTNIQHGGDHAYVESKGTDIH